MSERRTTSHVNPAVPPYLTYEEQLFVEASLATGGDISTIEKFLPQATHEECARLAADARVRSECEYRRELIDRVVRGEDVKPRIGHHVALEHEHIENARQVGLKLSQAGLIDWAPSTTSAWSG